MIAEVIMFRGRVRTASSSAGENRVRIAALHMVLPLFGLDFLAVHPARGGVPRLVAIGENHVLSDFFFLDIGVGAGPRMLTLCSRPKMFLAR